MQSRPSVMIAAIALFGAAAAAAHTAPPAVPASGASATAAAPLPTPPLAQPIPRSRWTAAQIRQSFDQADVNGDGQLTRAEAQRLAIMPRPFEDMDRDKDGVVTRAEYEASFTSD